MLVTCVFIQAKPQKHSTQKAIHAGLTDKIYRASHAARKEATEKDQHRKKARDVKYAWLTEEALPAFKEKSSKADRAAQKKYYKNLGLLEEEYMPALRRADGSIIYITGIDSETGLDEKVIQNRRNLW
jgi:outer membrane protein assembly factor BamA